MFQMDIHQNAGNNQAAADGNRNQNFSHFFLLLLSREDKNPDRQPVAIKKEPYGSAGQRQLDCRGRTNWDTVPVMQNYKNKNL